MSRNTRAELAALDVEFDGAMSAGDIQRLAALVADDFVYTHSSGVSQTRAEFLNAQAARPERSRREITEITVETHPDFAITRGELTITYTTGRPPHALRYTRVYRRAAESWRLASHRTTER